MVYPQVVVATCDTTNITYAVTVTNILNTSCNINLSRNVNITYGLITPATTVNDISALTADYLTIKNNALMTG